MWKINNIKIEKYHYFYLFVTFLFIGISSVELFSEGMFIDGLFYADISRNMAMGLGSFWKPYLSSTISEFYGHPPLALGLQSLWFRLFGDSIYVERFYSLSTFIIVGCIIVLIWGKLTNDKKNGWIPLFFWIIVSDIPWAVANNLLENTMSIFVCLSVLFYLNSLDTKRFIWIILSGFSLTLGLLSKGFVCLYIWSLPFAIWVFKRNRNFKYITIDTLILIVSTVIPIVFLYYCVPAAQNNMQNYFNCQILSSLNNVQTVDSRFDIIRIFFERTLPSWIAASIVIIWAFKRKITKDFFVKNLKGAMVFFFLVIAGVIPIMISMKQRGFYILTVYPLLALGIAYYLFPIINQLLEKNNFKRFKIFKMITIGVVAISILLSFLQINRIGRDKIMIQDVKAIIVVTGKNVTINVSPTIYSEWNLHGYFVRYGNVSLDKNPDHIYQYYLTINDSESQYLQAQYQLVSIKTEKYKLYKLKNIAVQNK